MVVLSVVGSLYVMVVRWLGRFDRGLLIGLRRRKVQPGCDAFGRDPSLRTESG